MKRFYFSKLIIPIVLLLGFNFNANAQPPWTTAGTYTYTVPASCQALLVDMAGAQGCDGCNSTSYPGGKGGRVQCELAVTGGQVLTIKVGARGGYPTGGAPGGGNGYSSGGGGGGYSAIQNASGTMTTLNALVVAGAGGGGDCYYGDWGGAGGGLIGGNGWYGCGGTCGSNNTSYCGQGGTQFAGGANGTSMGGTASFGQGANAYVGSGYGGGGGGGWYGGGGAYVYASGGGGSSYTKTGVTSAITHTQGYQSGAGYVNVIPLLPTVTATPSTLAFGPQMANTTSVPPKFFVLNGTYLQTGPLDITASCPNYFLSTDGVTWSNTINVAYTAPNISNVKVYVKFNPTAAGTPYNCVLAITGGGLASAINVTVTGSGVNQCTGTPTAGTSSASPTSGNILTPFTLSLTGTSVAGGLTYQWERSTTSATTGFAPISGAALSTYNFTGVSATTWYRCKVTCPNGGATATSTAVQVTVAGLAASSCTPTASATPNCCNFWVGNPGTPFRVFGDAGTMTDMYDPMGVGNTNVKYKDFTSTLSVDMSIGKQYNTDICVATNQNSIQIWIDFNNNGTFEDATETVGGIPVYSSGIQHPLITIPATGVTPGIYRMRVVVTYGQGNTPAQPRYPTIPSCPTTTVQYADTRDYTARITYPVCSGIPYPGIADASPLQGCQSFSTNLYNVGQQLGPGLSYQWMESPSGGIGTFFPVTGATNSVYTPTVTTTGTVYYQMRLTCSNGFQNAVTNPIAINKYDPPVVPTSSIGSFSFCTNTTITANATPTGGTWSTSNGTIATVNPTTGEITGVGIGNATLTYTLPTGCYSTAPMTVNQLPAQIQPANLRICQGTTITLTDSISGGTWTSGIPAAATINASSGLLTAIGATSVPIIYTLPTGCQVTSIVTINALPGLFITSPSVGSYCADASSTTAVTLSGSDIGVDYQLIHSGVTVTTLAGTGSNLNFGIQSAPGTYTIFARNSATTCARGMVASTNIVVNPLPSAQIVGGGGSYCQDGGGRIITLSGSQVGINYFLYRNGVVVDHGVGPVYVSGTGAATFFDLEFDAGIYTVRAENAVTGCSAWMAGFAIITIDPKPFPYPVTGGGGYCAGGSGVNVGLSNSITGINYSLYRDGSFVGMLSGTGAPLNFGAQTMAGYYTIEAVNTSTSCSNTMSGGANVVINMPPTAYNVIGSGSYCAGGTGRNISIDQSDAGVDYQVFYGGTPVGGIVSGTGLGISFGDFTSPGVYTVKGTDGTTTCVSTMTGVANITINSLPAVYNMGGGGNYCVGGTGVDVTLSSSASGINYQLHLNGSPVGAAMAGTGTALNFGAQTTAGVYTVVATNVATGCTRQMAGVSTVGVNPLPTSFNVTGSGAYCAGGPGLTVGLDYSNTGVSYQLYRGSTAVGTALTGSSAMLNFGAQTIAGTYTVKATNIITGCNVFMSGNAVITINPLPPIHVVTGGGSFCAGGIGKEVVLNGSNAGINYQLNLGLANVGSPVAGTGSAINFGYQTLAGTYTIVATDVTTNCSRYMFGGAPVVVNPLPTPFAMTGGGTYCAGGTGVHVGLSSSALGIKYQLYIDGSPSGSPLTGTGSSIDFGSQITPGTYTIVATNNTTLCTNNMPGSVVVATIPLPTAYTVSGGGSYCAGGTGVDIALSGTDNGLDYQLYRGTTMVGSALTGGGGSISFGLQTAGGNYTVVASDPTTGCSKKMNSSANVVINPLPGVFTVLGGGSYCDGGIGSRIYLSVSTLGIEYQLYNGATLVTTAMGTGSSVDFGYQTAAGTYNVVANNLTTSCSNNMAGSATVAINPLPETHNVIGGGSYCIGGTGVHIGLDNSDMGIKYQLFHGSTSVGTAVSGTGTAIDFGLKTAAGSYTVVATNTATTCMNEQTGSASISINPLPAKYSVTGGGNYCETGLGVHVGISGSDLGTNYQLYHGTTPVGVALPGTGAALGLGLQSAVGMYTVVARNGSTSCETGMNGSASVNILPILIPHVNLTSSVSGTVCEGQLVSFTASPVNGGSAPTYQWMVNGVNAAVGSSYSYVPLNGDVVTAVIHSTAQCAHPDTGSESMHMVVSTMQMPSASVSADPGSLVCTGSPVTFTATSLYGGTSPVMTWLNNGVEVASGATYSYYPSNGDIITFKLGSNFNCRLADEVFAVPVTMTVENPVLPIVTVTSSVNHTNIAPGQSVTFNASVVSAGPHPTYQWVINSTPVAGATQPTFTTSNLMNKDSITCEVTGVCGMVGFNATKVTVRTTGISQVTAGSDIRLIPNPNKGEFTVRGTLATSASEEVTFEVTNMLGQVVYSSKVIAQNGIINESVKLSSSLANGMYILNLRSGADNTVFHFVIEQ